MNEGVSDVAPEFGPFGECAEHDGGGGECKCDVKDEVEVVVFLEVFEAIAGREFGVEADKAVDAAEREGIAHQPEADAPQADVEQVLKQDARRVLLTD